MRKATVPLELFVKKISSKDVAITNAKIRCFVEYTYTCDGCEYVHKGPGGAKEINNFELKTIQDMAPMGLAISPESAALSCDIQLTVIIDGQQVILANEQETIVYLFWDKERKCFHYVHPNGSKYTEYFEREILRELGYDGE